MTSVVALLIKFVPYLIQASSTVPQLIDFVNQLRQIFTREKIWTPEQEAEFDARIEAHTNDPAWQIKPPNGS